MICSMLANSQIRNISEHKVKGKPYACKRARTVWRGGYGRLSLVGFSSSRLLRQMSLGLGVLLFGDRGPGWPRFRHEVTHHQSITSNQHPDDGENATRKTTQHAWARTLRGGATSHMGLG